MDLAETRSRCGRAQSRYISVASDAVVSAALPGIRGHVTGLARNASGVPRQGRRRVPARHRRLARVAGGRRARHLDIEVRLSQVGAAPSYPVFRDSVTALAREVAPRRRHVDIVGAVGSRAVCQREVPSPVGIASASLRVALQARGARRRMDRLHSPIPSRSSCSPGLARTGRSPSPSFACSSPGGRSGSRCSSRSARPGTDVLTGGLPWPTWQLPQPPSCPGC